MQITQIRIFTHYSETHNISNTLPQIISEPENMYNIESHNQQRSMPQHPENTKMFSNHRTIISKILQLYQMKIPTTLNISNRFWTQTLLEQQIEQLQHQ